MNFDTPNTSKKESGNVVVRQLIEGKEVPRVIKGSQRPSAEALASRQKNAAVREDLTEEATAKLSALRAEMSGSRPKAPGSERVMLTADQVAAAKRAEAMKKGQVRGEYAIPAEFRAAAAESRAKSAGSRESGVPSGKVFNLADVAKFEQQQQAMRAGGSSFEEMQASALAKATEKGGSGVPADKVFNLADIQKRQAEEAAEKSAEQKQQFSLGKWVRGLFGGKN